MAAPALKMLMAAAGNSAGVPVLPITTNLWAQWDASNAASITSASNLVSQWNDLSGNGRHLVQATGAQQPTTGTTTQGPFALNVLVFGGLADMRLTAAIGFDTADYTIFLVVNNTSAPNQYRRFMCFHNASGNDYDQNNAFAITDGAFGAEFHIFQGSVSLAGTTGVGGTTFGTRVVRKNTGSNQYQILERSNTLYQTTNASSGTANGGVIVGAGYEGGLPGTNRITGQIAEILVYTDEKNDTDRGTIRSYLVSKWGA